MQPVLILGAGINGAAVARDLAINGVPVCIVDTNDIAFGATSRSSRLIHGGLRYLEYRDIDLVRESLDERERLLRLAPQFVTPLRLSIPVAQRMGGLRTGAVRFSGLARTGVGDWLHPRQDQPRGLYAVQFGLSLYDRLSGSTGLPGHSTHRVSRFSDRPKVDPHRFHWLCEYSDAQLIYPERFVLALLHDAQQAAAQTGQSFDVLPRHTARLNDRQIVVRKRGMNESDEVVRELTPALIINATGAWGDRTLEMLGVREPAPKLFAGTKGSHLFSTHEPLKSALAGQGIYAEASDGRLVFILPCASGVLIGTTDEPFDDSPDDAVASDTEIAYLIRMVNEVFPQVSLERSHVEMHHAGVRPLPNVETETAAAIPRGHSIAETTVNDIPILTLVGGKLTTCRALAEEVTDRTLAHFGLSRHESTSDRFVPGGQPVAGNNESGPDSARRAGEKFGLSPAQAETVWRLVGNRFDEVFDSSVAGSRTSITGTDIPIDFVRWSIRNEWITNLDDLVERRLMLTFAPALHRGTLAELAALMTEQRCHATSAEADAVESTIARLGQYYGKSVLSD